MHGVTSKNMLLLVLVQQFKNIKQASIAVADQILNITNAAVSDKGFCTIVLAGGQTPRHTYELLSTLPKADQMPWQQTHFFWGDERWVASTHPDSNFSMAHKTFLSRVHIPPQNIHQMPTGHQDPETGAEMYEKHLRDFFHSRPLAETSNISGDITFPSFDLVLLGMEGQGRH